MTIYNSISSNKWKTYLIMALFISFFGVAAYIFGQATGYGLSFTGIVLIISGFISFGSYYYSDKIVLSLSNAHLATKEKYRTLYTTVENLSIASGLPMPKIYVMNESSPNAFATGRDPKHAVVCATTGLLEKLNKSELEGVIAHELSHVGNYDTRLLGIVSILVGSIALLADIFMRSLWLGGNDRNKNNQIFMILAIIFAILAPIIATLIKLAVSRKREFLADASGALLTRYPEGLASALEKIASDPKQVEKANLATSSLYISNPFKKEAAKNWFVKLFSTHPPVEERVKILRSM